MAGYMRLWKQANVDKVAMVTRASQDHAAMRYEGVSMIDLDHSKTPVEASRDMAKSKVYRSRGGSSSSRAKSSEPCWYVFG